MEIMVKKIIYLCVIISCMLSSEAFSSIPNCGPVTVADQFWYECDGIKFTQTASLSNGDTISEFKVKDRGTLGYLVYWKYYDGTTQESAYYKTYDGFSRFRVTQSYGQASNLKLVYIHPVGEERWFWRYKSLESQETAYFATNENSSTANAVTHIAHEESGDSIDEFTLINRGQLGFIAYWRYEDGSNPDSIYYYITLGLDLSETSQRRMITQSDGQASDLKLFYGTTAGGEQWYWKYEHESGNFGYYFKDYFNGTSSQTSLITQFGSGPAGDVIDEFTITAPSGDTPGPFVNNLLSWRYFDAQNDRWGCYSRDTYFNQTITEYTSGCVLPPKAIVSASWNPETVYVGEQQTFTWSSTHTTSCTNAAGTQLAKSGSITLTPSSPLTQTSELTCTGLGGSTTVTATRKALAYPAPTVNASWNPATVHVGEQQTFTWSSTHATSCTNAVGMQLAESGSIITLAPSNPLTQTSVLTCTGPGGTTSDQATRTVLP